MSAFMVAMGSRPGYDDLIDYTFTDQECLDMDTNARAIDGHSYFISLKVYIYVQANVVMNDPNLRISGFTTINNEHMKHGYVLFL